MTAQVVDDSAGPSDAAGDPSTGTQDPTAPSPDNTLSFTCKCTNVRVTGNPNGPSGAYPKQSDGEHLEELWLNETSERVVSGAQIIGHRVELG